MAKTQPNLRAFEMRREGDRCNHGNAGEEKQDISRIHLGKRPVKVDLIVGPPSPASSRDVSGRYPVFPARNSHDCSDRPASSSQTRGSSVAFWLSGFCITFDLVDVPLSFSVLALFICNPAPAPLHSHLQYT